MVCVQKNVTGGHKFRSSVRIKVQAEIQFQPPPLTNNEQLKSRSKSTSSFSYNMVHITYIWVDQDSAVGIVTGYGLDGLGIESWWKQDFPHLSRPALGPTQPPVQRVFPGGKERLGQDANSSALLVLWSRKSRAIPLLALSRTTWTEPQCLYNSALYLPLPYLYLKWPDFLMINARQDNKHSCL
jgi:hypothetical protein